MTTRLRHADLDGGKPDAGRRIHGLEHVVDQRAQRLVDRLHRLGLQPQPLVGKDEDVAHGHGARCKGESADGSMRFPLETSGIIALPFAFRSLHGRIALEAHDADASPHWPTPLLIAIAWPSLAGSRRRRADRVAGAAARTGARPGGRATAWPNSMRGIDAMGELAAERARRSCSTAVNERLDAVSQHLGESLKTTTKHTVEHLQQLHERLAVIDSAQKNITDLATAGDVAAERARQQAARGAFGQGRMEIDHPGWAAEGRLRIPVHAVEQVAAGLRASSARQPRRWSSTPSFRSRL